MKQPQIREYSLKEIEDAAAEWDEMTMPEDWRHAIEMTDKELEELLRWDDE